MLKKITLYSFLCFSLHFTLSAQEMPIGFLDLDGHARSLQLLSKIDSSISFFIRPSHYNLGFASSRRNKQPMTDAWMGIDTMMPRSTRFSFFKQKGVIQLLPAMMRVKFNSHHPYGWNDEAMRAAKGLQTSFSTGMFAQLGPLSVQVQPEWYQGGNPNFQHNAAFGAPTSGAYSKLLPGNSNLLLHAGPMAAGISTQSIWWGPGQFSSLILSNNATPFTHLTFHTTRPVKTPVGHFEWQLVLARLDEDSAKGGLYENFHLKPAVLTEDSRYYNAVSITYQPRFLKHFYIGASRAFQIYSRDLDEINADFFNKYLVALNPGFKKSSIQDQGRRGDQQASVFARWVFPKAHGEFYFEYGQNDHKANYRDYAINIQAGAAYIVGFKKLFPLKQKRFIEMAGELTQMAQSTDWVLRNTGNWYVHWQMYQGMTNDRQTIGAGSGQGNNVQSVKLNWVNGIQKLGVVFQRIQHDPKALAGGSILLLRPVFWNEYAYGIYGRYAYKRFVGSLDMHVTTTRNYAWEKGMSRTNFYSMLNIAYIW